METIALIGAGGHCKVIIDLIELLNKFKIVGVYDDHKTGYFNGYRILGNTKEIDSKINNFIVTIGNNRVRKKIYESNLNLNWITLIHPSVIISKNVKVGEGTVICAGSIIQPDVVIGKHCIINTGASIDHESVIGDFCSISPHATVCGQVKIRNMCFIGANSTIIQCLEIGSNSIIGAGSVIIRHVENEMKVVGNPGKKI